MPNSLPGEVVIFAPVGASRKNPLPPSIAEQAEQLGLRARVRLVALAPLLALPGADTQSYLSALASVPAQTRGRVRTEVLPFVPLPRAPGWARMLSALARVLPRRSEVHVLLGHRAAAEGFGAVTVGAELGIPAVVQVHGSDLQALRYGPREDRTNVLAALRRATAVVVPSEAVHAAVVRAVPDGAPAFVVEPGLDRERFAPMPMPGNRRVLLAGRLTHAKGVSTVLAALARLPDCTLVVAGRGPLEPQVRANPRVQWLGEVPHGEMPEVYRGVQCVCVPSLDEDHGLVAAEALACGRPVVASDVPGLAELIAPATGVRVAPGDAPALADALTTCLHAAWEPSALAETTAKRAWTVVAPRLLDILLRAAGN